jgi:hypothetical protein
MCRSTAIWHDKREEQWNSPYNSLQRLQHLTSGTAGRVGIQAMVCILFACRLQVLIVDNTYSWYGASECNDAAQQQNRTSRTVSDLRHAPVGDAEQVQAIPNALRHSLVNNCATVSATVSSGYTGKPVQLSLSSM